MFGQDTIAKKTLLKVDKQKRNFLVASVLVNSKFILSI
jgi:hypothetical protein